MYAQQNYGEPVFPIKAGRKQYSHAVIKLYTAVSRKVVQLKSMTAYATIPTGMTGCGCSLFYRQVHEFSARWKAVL